MCTWTAAAAGGLYGCGDGNAAGTASEKRNPSRGNSLLSIDDPVLESDTPLSDEEAEQALLFALRPDGLVNSGEEIYRAMDQNFEGKSQMIPVEIKKNGEISTARSKVASTEEFAVITRYVEHEIRQCGEAIYAGNIAVNPYRSDIETSCTYCPYGSVCGMDAKIPGYEYRQFAS